MVLAPLLGAAVDAAVATGVPDWAPVAGVGLAIACAGVVATRRHWGSGVA